MTQVVCRSCYILLGVSLLDFNLTSLKWEIADHQGLGQFDLADSDSPMGVDFG